MAESGKIYSRRRPSFSSGRSFRPSRPPARALTPARRPMRTRLPDSRGRLRDVSPRRLPRRVASANVCGRLGHLAIVERIAEARHVAAPVGGRLVNPVVQHAQQVVRRRLTDARIESHQRTHAAMPDVARFRMTDRARPVARAPLSRPSVAMASAAFLQSLRLRGLPHVLRVVPRTPPSLCMRAFRLRAAVARRFFLRTGTSIAPSPRPPSGGQPSSFQPALRPARFLARRSGIAMQVS